MNLLMAVNESYLDKLNTMIFSLNRKYVRDENERVELFLMNSSLNSDSINILNSFLREQNIFLHVIEMDGTFDSFPLPEHISVETYFRCIAQFILPKNIDRILWIDADVIINDDFSDFYRMNFEDKSIICVPDTMCESQSISCIKRMLDINPAHKYFNAGVLLLNIEKMRKGLPFDKIIECIVSMQDRLSYADQDVLNYLYQNDVIYVSDKYNYQVLDESSYYEVSNSAIIHYVGFKKPWIYRYMNRNSLFYWKTKFEQGMRFRATLACAVGIPMGYVRLLLVHVKRTLRKGLRKY